jgi:hypothetical protein
LIHSAIQWKRNENVRERWNATNKECGREYEKIHPI